MIEQSAMWVVIVAVAVGTFVLRGLFLVARRSTEPPPALVDALRMIPPAAFAALVVPALLRPNGPVDLLTPGLFAGVLAALVAWRTRNIAATIAVGLVSVIVLEQICGLS